MKPIILQPGPQAWLSSSILSAYQDRYVARLRQDRYAHNVIRVYLASVAHFARCLTSNTLAFHRCARRCWIAFLTTTCQFAVVDSRFVGRGMNYGPPFATF
ncbi:hypothetical protein GOL25_32110 [Sinorhizobium medicae]|nr:hypothetical protein [Sinorhizobium medicae]